MKDLSKFLVGTTVPFTPPAMCLNEFGRSEENFKLMKDAGLNIVRNFTPFPFTDESMTEETEAYKQLKKDIKLYAEHGIATMGMFGNPGQNAADSKGTVSYIRHYPD